MQIAFSIDRNELIFSFIATSFYKFNGSITIYFGIFIKIEFVFYNFDGLFF